MVGASTFVGGIGGLGICVVAGDAVVPDASLEPRHGHLRQDGLPEPASSQVPLQLLLVGLQVSRGQLSIIGYNPAVLESLVDSQTLVGIDYQQLRDEVLGVLRNSALDNVIEIIQSGISTQNSGWNSYLPAWMIRKSPFWFSWWQGGYPPRRM